MAPLGLILTVALKVLYSMSDTRTSLVVRNATGDCGFSVVQCTTTPRGLEGAIKMQVVALRQRSPGSLSAYDVHLMYVPISGIPKYFKVDNITNKVYLDNEMSVQPPFRAEAVQLPDLDDEPVFFFTKTNSGSSTQLLLKLKFIVEDGLDCPSNNDGSSSADEVRYTDSQELVMLSVNGGINTHRHIIGRVIEC